MDYIVLKVFIDGFESVILFAGDYDTVVSTVSPHINFYVEAVRINEELFRQLCSMGFKSYYLPKFEVGNNVGSVDSSSSRKTENFTDECYNSLK